MNNPVFLARPYFYDHDHDDEDVLYIRETCSAVFVPGTSCIHLSGNYSYRIIRNFRKERIAMFLHGSVYFIRSSHKLAHIWLNECYKIYLIEKRFISVF